MNWNLITSIVNIAIAVLWGIYVYFTIRTFKAIQLQTQRQTQAFLVIESSVSTEITISGIFRHDKKISELEDKWQEILKNNIVSSLTEEKWLCLKLINRGRSDIIWWKITFTAHILPGDYLDKLNIRGEISKWVIEYSGHIDNIPESGELLIEIVKINSFPRLSISWEIEYKDIHDNAYQRFAGDSSKITRNFLAFQYNKKKDLKDSDFEDGIPF